MGRLASSGWLPPSTIAPRGRATSIVWPSAAGEPVASSTRSAPPPVRRTTSAGDVIVGGVQGDVRPERQGRVAVPGDEVCGHDEPRAEDPQPLDEHEADRSGPEDDGRVARDRKRPRSSMCRATVDGSMSAAASNGSSSGTSRRLLAGSATSWAKAPSRREPMNE